MRHRAALKEKFADELVKRAEETKSGNKKMNKEGDKSQGEQDDQTAQVFRYARIKQSARKVRNVLIGDFVFESKFEKILNSDLWKKSCLRH